jgi:quercetin dioxygenase-like cupin family protein
MNLFPQFLRNPINAVAGAPEGMKGYLFLGADETQVVFWENESGGKCQGHSHPFDEYACIIQGRWAGRLGALQTVLARGQECHIPARILHSGEHSANYRAVDAWAGPRVRYLSAPDREIPETMGDRPEARASPRVRLDGFPAFLRNPENLVAEAPDGMKGYLFEGRDETQIVFWENESGGSCPEHSHDFDEYALVIQGYWEGFVGGEFRRLNPGDECFIPAGTPHGGLHSPNYRAIDAWAGRRVRRMKD